MGNFEPLFSSPDKPALFKDLIDGVYSYLPDTQVKYRYMLSNARLVHELNALTVDGAANIFSPNDIKGCLSQPIFEFSDVAISLKSQQLVINKVDDLRGKSVVSYQGAKTLLGSDYKAAVESGHYYKEVSQPEEQAKLLLTGMVDVSIGDKYIFLNSLKNWSKGKHDPNQIIIHTIFPPVATSMGFNEQAFCDEFDQGLKKFKESGRYREVYKRYLKDLGYDG